MLYPNRLQASKLLAASSLVLLSIVGCKTDQPADETQTTTQTAAQTTTEPEALSLTVYSGRAEVLVAPLIEKFEAASNVTVNVKYGKSGELAGTLLEEGDKSPADVFWSQDASTIGVLASKGVLAPLPAEVTAPVAAPFKSASNDWVATSGRARVLVYNTEKLKPEDLPKSAAELTDPAWKGRVGWAPENASFQSSVAAMVELEGADATKKWLEGMVANGAKVFPSNTPAVVATAAGEVDVALVNHYYLFRLKKEHGEGFAAENHYFANGKAESLVNVTGIGQLKTSKNSEAAQKFIAYLLSEDAQKYFATETYEFPGASGVTALEGLPAIETLNVPTVDFAKLDNLEASVKLLRETKALP